MSRIKMFIPSATKEDIINFVVETAKLAGSNPCPPMVLGVGIGGDFELCAYLAKKAFGSKKNARGLRDCVRRDVEEKIANAIVFNQDEEIKSLSLSVENDDIKIKIN